MSLIKRYLFFCCSPRSACIIGIATTLVISIIILFLTINGTSIIEELYPPSHFFLISSIFAVTSTVVSLFCLIEVLLKKEETSWLMSYIIVQSMNCVFNLFCMVELVRLDAEKKKFEKAVNETSIIDKDRFILNDVVSHLYPTLNIFQWFIIIVLIGTTFYFALAGYVYKLELKERLQFPSNVIPVASTIINTANSIATSK